MKRETVPQFSLNGRKYIKIDQIGIAFPLLRVGIRISFA